MQDELLKYRGLQPDGKMESRRFIHLHNILTKESRDGQVDPFPYKYAVAPPKTS